VPRVTALRPDRRGRVEVELDHARWRLLPAEVVARTRLREGADLDRASLRRLRRELRRHEAVALAARALRHRDLSRVALEERLDAAGVGTAVRAEALGTLERAGFVDDARLAEERAGALARRGYGDTAIRADLARRGIGRDLAEAALGALDPERERAAAVVSRRGTGPRAAAFLRRRGFSDEVVEAALEVAVAPEP
jgi:regulatory protein